MLCPAPDPRRGSGVEGPDRGYPSLVPGNAGSVPRDHIVRFYDSDAELVGEVTTFVAEGLSLGEPAVVIARPGTSSAVRDALAGRAFDLDRVRFIDAAEALGAFMVCGLPDPGRFREVIGTVVAQAARAGARPRAFGEMVAVLWEQANAAAAIALEGLWNDLATEVDFVLCCAYPISALSAADDLRSATEICNSHSEVVAPPSYLTGAGMSEIGAERSQVFIPTRSATTGARRFIIDALRSWDLEALAGDASIVISELAANAVQHAASAFRVTVRRDGSKVRIAVEDADTAEPKARERAIDGNGGFGMMLVRGLASTSGLHVTPDGKTVWAYVGA